MHRFVANLGHFSLAACGCCELHSGAAQHQAIQVLHMLWLWLNGMPCSKAGSCCNKRAMSEVELDRLLHKSKLLHHWPVWSSLASVMHMACMIMPLPVPCLHSKELGTSTA
jgi:hypothetical protein